MLLLVQNICFWYQFFKFISSYYCLNFLLWSYISTVLDIYKAIFFLENIFATCWPSFQVMAKIRSLFIYKKYNLKKKTWTEDAAGITSRLVTKDFILLLIWYFNLCTYSAYCYQKWFSLFFMSKCSHTLGKMEASQSTPLITICPIVSSSEWWLSMRMC